MSTETEERVSSQAETARGTTTQQEAQTVENGSSIASNGGPLHSTHRLRLNPHTQHQPDCYDDLDLEFSPLLFASLERYLPHSMLHLSRDLKLQYMRTILQTYSPDGERYRIKRQKDYRQRIASNYQPLHRELYTMNAESFFVPSFLKAINENTEESFRSIISEPLPGVYTFEMLQTGFCETMLAEVENFECWVRETNFRIMRPNTMNKYGAVLDDFGLGSMLKKLMTDFICPLSNVFFSDVGGSTLDSHHGFVVEYGTDRDVDLGFHVDDSEVTLNVCLGKNFCGGELFFRGVRCDKHVNTEAQLEEISHYYHRPGHAVFHSGSHRHGAKATLSGHRINFLLWCRSSIYREMKKYQKDFSSWCGVCYREKKEKRREWMAATKLELLKKNVDPSSS